MTARASSLRGALATAARTRLGRALADRRLREIWLAPPLLGAALSWSQAPAQAFWLTPPALAVMAALFLRAGSVRAAARLGWLFGVGYFIPGLMWIGQAFLVEADRFAWMRPFAVTLLPMGLSLFWAAAFAAARTARRRFAPEDAGAGALILALCWAVAELARGYVLTGFPWGLFAFGWIDTPLAQSAALIGAYGLNLVLIAGGCCLGAAILEQGRRRAGLLALAIGPAAALALAGWARPALPSAEGGALIRLVQPNVPQTEKWVPEFMRRNFDRLIALSRAPDQPAPALIVWPETATPFLVDREPDLLRQVMSQLPPGARLVVGSQRFEPVEGGRRWFNSLFVIDSAGEIEAVYDKHHLVPFGEYLPFQNVLEWLGMRQLAGRMGGFSSGPGPRTLRFEGAPDFAPLICYEAIFPQDMPSVQDRPSLLLQITNDAWFGDSSGPYQHLAQARWRAIEQGLPLVRAANTGISAAIDAHGGVLLEVVLGVADAVTFPAPPPLSPTLYSRFGETTFCIVGCFFITFSYIFRRGARKI